DFGLREDVVLGIGGLTDGALVDLNGDTLPDLLELSAATSTLELGLGVLPSGFVSLQSLPTPGVPLRVVAADLDLDAQLELVVVCESPLPPPPGLATVAGRLALFDGDGAGSYALVDTLELPARSLSLVAGPLYAAGADVLAIAIPEDQSVWVVEVDLGGGLALRQAFDVPGADGLAGPLSVALVDVGGEGLQDLVLGLRAVVAGGVDDLAVVRQTAPDTFGAPQYLATPVAEPFVATLGDLDGNGLADVGVAQLDEATTWGFVLRNAAGGLQTPQLVNFTGGASELAAGDFDGDGRLDLAASLFAQHAVAVLLANGIGGYDPALRYNVGAVPLGVGVVALPGDLHADIYCVNAADTSLLRGDGQGAFRAAEGYYVGDEPRFLELERLDGDAYFDAVSIDLFQRRIAFLRGGPSNQFSIAGHVALDPSMSETPAAFLLDDFDGDTRPDLLVSVNASDALQLLRNPGVLPFGAADPDDRVDVGSEPLGIDSGDLSGDGVLDVVVANSGDDTIQVLIGDGSGGFTPLAPLAVPGRPLAVRIADLDVDGLADVLVSTGHNDGSGTSLLVLGGNGQGQLVLLDQIPIPAIAISIEAADLDGDGLPEVVAGQSDNAFDEVVLLHNGGLFDFTAELLPVGPNPLEVELVDIDLDGVRDLLTPLGSGELVALKNDGQAGFTPLPFASAPTRPVPFGTTSSAVLDLDGDSLPELLMVTPFAPHVWVAHNESLVVTQP
ncbi:MAG TPA: VCBS repeat-containing protein, partial [Planctomycetota bacterium]|nr:VCBS repeat-containing protein [Planctomycetota bacterium]